MQTKLQSNTILKYVKSVLMVMYIIFSLKQIGKEKIVIYMYMYFKNDPFKILRY
jgi:hypothetical protein